MQNVFVYTFKKTKEPEMITIHLKVLQQILIFPKSVPYANSNLPNTKSADSAILLNNGSQRFILAEFQRKLNLSTPDKEIFYAKVLESTLQKYGIITSKVFTQNNEGLILKFQNYKKG